MAQDQLSVERSLLVEIVMAVLVGLAAGAVTSLLQGRLGPLDPFANSVGSWSALGALLASRTRRPGIAVLVGVLVLWSLIGGYLLATELRGLSMSRTFVLFWVACGAFGGPILGLAGSWLRHCTAARDALAVAALAGLLLGEAVYGLTVLAATTGATYWVLQTAVSLALLVGWAARRRPETRWLALAIVGTAAGAGSFALVWVSLSISASV